jgi:uncharacterized protein YbjT (DUF2867 family)
MTSLAKALCTAVLVCLTITQAACGTSGGSSQPLVVLVVGATGGTGQQVVKQAQAKGYTVRAVVRDESKARDLLGGAVQYVVADVRQPASLLPAFKDVDYVVSAIGSNSRRDPQNKPEFIDYGGVKTLAEQAKRAGVRHFVLVSSMGVTDPDHMLNKVLDNILVWKLKGEDALRASGVSYTVVRPGGLTDDAGGQFAVRTMQGDPKGSQGRIARADVAAVCIAALGRKDAVGKTFELVSDPTTKPTDLAGLFADLRADGR